MYSKQLQLYIFDLAWGFVWCIVFGWLNRFGIGKRSFVRAD